MTTTISELNDQDEQSSRNDLNVQDTNPPFAGASPGMLLKAAREAKRLRDVEVARRLHLSLKSIHELEADDYTHFAGWTYVRGYLLSYGHLVEVEENQLAAAMKTIAMPETDN